MDQATVIILIGASSGLCALISKLCYSSRCTHVSCCGLSIDRDTAHETAVSFSNNNGNTTPSNNNIV